MDTPSPYRPTPYPPAGPVPAARPRRSALLGVLSLIIQVVALLLIAAVAYGLIAIANGTPAFGLLETRPLLAGPALAGTIVGLIGIILAIIAIATRRGRMFGVIALALMPLSWLVAFAGLYLSYLAS